MAVLPPVIATLTADISEFSAKMAEAKGEMADVSDSGGGSFSKLSSLGGTALLGVAGIAAAVGGVAVDLGMKFQTATNHLAASAGISIGAATKIGAAFLSTAGKTVFSAQEMVKAYTPVAAQLGLIQGHALTSAQALQFMSVASDLAEASGTSLTAATKSLAATMQAYQIKLHGAAGASNDLFNAARLTGQSVTSVSTALDKVKTKLGGVAPSLAETSGLLVDLTAHGESGRAAMSSLTTAFTAFLKPAADAAKAQNDLKVATEDLTPTLASLAKQVQAGTLAGTALSKVTKTMTAKQQALWSAFTSSNSAVNLSAQALQKMGVNALEATGKLRPLSTIVGQVHKQITGMSVGQATATLTADGFGSSSAKLVGVFQSGSGALDKYVAQVNKTNSAHAAAEKVSKSFSEQMKMLGAWAEDEGVKLGKVLIPKLELLVHDVENVVEWFGRNKDAAYALAGVVTGVLGVAIGAFAITTMQKWISSIRSGITAVKSFAAKLAGTTTAITSSQSEIDTAASGTATTFTEAKTSIGTSMTETAAEVDTQAQAIIASLAEIDGAVATTQTSFDTLSANAGISDLSGAGLVGANGAPLGTAATGGATSTIESAGGAGLLETAGAGAAAGTAAGEATGGEEVAAAGATGGEEVAGGAVAGGGLAEGAGIVEGAGGLSLGAIIPVVVAAVAAYVVVKSGHKPKPTQQTPGERTNELHGGSGATGRDPFSIPGPIAITQIQHAYGKTPTPHLYAAHTALTGLASGAGTPSQDLGALKSLAGALGPVGSQVTHLVAQVEELKSKYGANSAQYKAAVEKLQSAENKWGAIASKDVSVKLVLAAQQQQVGKMASLISEVAKGAKTTKLTQANAKLADVAGQVYLSAVYAQQLKKQFGEDSPQYKAALKHLDTTQKRYGDLAAKDKSLAKTAQDSSIQTLHQKLLELQSQLAKETTQHASQSVLQSTESKIASLTSRLVEAHSLESQLTKTSDTIAMDQHITTAVGKVDSDARALKASLDAGVAITKLPNTSIKATGTVNLKVG